MSASRLLEEFIRAESGVAAGEHALSRQRRRIRALEREGRDAFARYATTLLEELERSQRILILHRDRIRAKLKASTEESGRAAHDPWAGRRAPRGRR